MSSESSAHSSSSERLVTPSIDQEGALPSASRDEPLPALTEAQPILTDTWPTSHTPREASYKEARDQSAPINALPPHPSPTVEVSQLNESDRHMPKGLEGHEEGTDPFLSPESPESAPSAPPAPNTLAHLDHKLHEESELEIVRRLSSQPVQPLPAESPRTPSVNPPAQHVPNLGLDAVGEAAANSMTFTPAPEHPTFVSDEEQQSSSPPVARPVQTPSGEYYQLTPTPEHLTESTEDSEEEVSVKAVEEPSPEEPPPEPQVEIPDSVEIPYRKIELQSHVRPIAEKSIRRLEAFLNTLERARGSNVLIVIKGHPDPDSIGSAVAQQYCFKQYEITSAILYFDEISHPENRALVKVIDMELTLYREDFDFSVYDYLAFVDTQSGDLPVSFEGKFPPILTFVDHHKATGKVEAEFLDVREDAGATSSIYAEYLEYIPDLSLQKSSGTHAHIATALMHGIRTDTDNLMLATPNDFYAAAYLRQFIDRDLLRTVSKQSVTPRTMEIIKQGLNNKLIRGTFLLAGVGFVREEDRDGISQTADFLLRHEGVETAVVFGIVNNNLVDGSLRTSSATVDPDRWLKDLFGQDSSGKPFGGGRRNKGGFRIPLGLLALSPDRKALWKLGEQTIHDLIFDKIGEKEGESEER